MAEQVKVFLSYRRADTQHVAGRAADRLGDRYELFMDMDTIPPGVDFTDYVRRAVGNCDVLLAFIGEQWLTQTDRTGRRRIDDPQDWVVQEISAALQRGLRVIPVLVEGAEMPAAYELPGPLAPLVNRQALPLRHSSFSADLTRLMAGIDHAGAEHRAALAAQAAPALTAPHTMEPATTAEHGRFAERWDQSPGPAVAPISISIPEAKPRRRRLIIGTLVIMIAAVLGAVIAIARPFDFFEGAGTQGTTGGGAGSGASTPPASTTRPTVTPAKTVSELRAHVPATFRQTCGTLSPEPAVLRAGLVVAVQCAPAQGKQGSRTPEYTFYFQYSTADAATAAFRGYYASGNAPVADCTAGPGERPYQRPDGSGILRCYQDADGYRVFAWTNDDLGILASVADRTMSYPELATWWEAAGPIR
jgi:hypothetical protein